MLTAIKKPWGVEGWGWVDGWMDGWMGGWVEAKAGLRIAYSCKFANKNVHGPKL